MQRHLLTHRLILTTKLVAGATALGAVGAASYFLKSGLVEALTDSAAWVALLSHAPILTMVVSVTLIPASLAFLPSVARVNPSAGGIAPNARKKA